MYLQKNSEKKWLIKSENKILGPYSFDQILDLLRKKQISIIDEIRDPETRWLYVRENNEFKNIVEEIRKEIDSKQESTKTFQSVAGFTGVTTSGYEDTVSKTKTDIVFDQQEENTQARDAEVVNETIAPPVENIPQIKMMEKAKLYGVMTDENVQDKIGDYSRRLKIIAASIVILLLTAMGSYYYFQYRSEIKREEELVTQVKKLKAYGLYELAAQKYVNLPPVARHNLLPVLLEMYPTMQKTGAATLDEIKELKAGGLTPEQEAHVELISFWNAAKQQDMVEAENALLRANVKKQSLILIKENDGWLNYKKGQYAKAYDQFKMLFDREKSGRYLFGMVLSFFNSPPAVRADFGRELLTSLERYTLVYFDLKKELLIGQIYLAKQMNEEAIYNISLRQFFNTPTMMSMHFNRPDLLMPDTYNWSDLAPIIEAIKVNLTGDQAALFEMHNLIESAKLNSADSFLNNSQGKLADIKILAQMSLLQLNAQGRSAEVLALGKSGTLDMTSELNSFVLAYNQIKSDPSKNVGIYLKNLESKEYVFYKEWLELEQLKAKGPSPALKNFLQDHFFTTDNFIPVSEARSLGE